MGETLLDTCISPQDALSDQQESLKSILKDLLQTALLSGDEEAVHFTIVNIQERSIHARFILPAFGLACRRGLYAVKALFAYRDLLTEDYPFTGVYTVAIYS